MLDRIAAFKWQLAFGGVAAAGVVLSDFLIAAQVDNARLAKLNARLDDEINNPITGYVRQVAEVRTNADTTRLALEGQVRDLQAKADADARALAETKDKLAATRSEVAQIRRQVNTLLAYQPKGDTLEAQVLDADAKVLEMLK